MELFDFVQLIKNKRKTIFSIVFTTLVLVIGVTFVLPQKYSSQSQILIIQNNLNNTDPYLVSKSSEHLGNILSRVIYSGSFYKKVVNSGFGINETYFGKTYRDQLKKWDHTVSAKNIEDTGIIQISAVHPDRKQAGLIVEAIDYILKTSNKDYHGSGDNVKIKIIDEATTSNFPTNPNILINIIAGFIFSLIFSFLYIYLFPDKKYDLTLLPKRRNRKLKKVQSFLVEETILESKTEKKYLENSKAEKIEKGEKQEENHFNKKEIYQVNKLAEIDNNDFSGYEEENKKNDDLDIDYEEIKRKGNINNIL